MRTLVAAATGLPVIRFPAGLVVIRCFWLLVNVGAASAGCFGANVLLIRLLDAGQPAFLTRPVVPAGALFAACLLTCLFVRPLHRLFPDEPGPVRPTAAQRRSAA